MTALFLLTNCQPGLPDEGGPKGNLFSEQPTVLWDAGDLGLSTTGEPLEADHLYVADLDADGSDEIVIYTSYSYLNQLEPSPVLVFDVRNGAMVNVSTEYFPNGPPSAVVNRDMHFADMNGDGYLDLFLSNHGTEAFIPFPGEQNRIYLSDGEGQWFDATSTHLPQILDFSHGSAVGDIDGDDIPEIHVVNLGGGESPGNYLLKQDEAGRFVSLGNPGSTGGFFSKFFDLGGDGDMDLFLGPAQADDEGWQHLVLVNDGKGDFHHAAQDTLPKPREFPDYDPSAPLPEDLIVGDINGDGLEDVLAFSRYGDFLGSFFEVYINHADGILTDETALRLPAQDFGPIRTGVPRAQLVDVDGDGDLDLQAATWNWSADPLGSAFLTWYYLNDGSGFFLEPIPVPASFGPTAIVFDANADGTPDLVTIHTVWDEGGGSYLSVYHGLPR